MKKMNRGKGFLCLDCKVPTWDEYYMLHDETWAATGMQSQGGQLCIGCCENRLGRQLVLADFTDVPLNDPRMPWPRTERLRNRLTGM